MPKGVQEKRMSKYHNQITACDNITFASKREMEHYQELKLLLGAGEITDLELQKRYPLVVNGIKVCEYRADFTYRDRAGVSHVQDAKGYRTQVYRLKKRLMAACYGIEIEEV